MENNRALKLKRGKTEGKLNYKQILKEDALRTLEASLTSVKSPGRR